MQKSILQTLHLWAFQDVKTLMIVDKEITVELDFRYTILDTNFVNIGNYC